MGAPGKDANKGRLLYAKYGAGDKQVDATGFFNESLMRASDLRASRSAANLGFDPDWEYAADARLYDVTGDVAPNRQKYVWYGYTDSAGNYKTDWIDDSFGTIPGSLIKRLRGAMGLVDAPHTKGPSMT
jgi:hypothetical protein